MTRFSVPLERIMDRAQLTEVEFDLIGRQRNSAQLIAYVPGPDPASAPNDSGLHLLPYVAMFTHSI